MNGWQMTRLAEKHAPNFGGEEWWWECEFQHDDGRTVFATGKTAADAKQEAINRINNPPADTIPTSADGDIPF